MEQMQSAKLSTTTRSAPVPEDTAEIHSSTVTKIPKLSLHQKGLTFLACHLHVVQMLSAEKLTDMKHVLVAPDTLAVLQIVDRNVSSMQSVPVTRPVSSRDVLIPVLVPVDIMPDAQQSIIMPSVLALRATLVILSLDVHLFQKVRNHKNIAGILANKLFF